MHNKKLELAYDVIEELEKNYPNSSLIKTCLIEYFTSKNDSPKVAELLKNMELLDSSYYFSVALKAADSEWIKTTSLAELEKYRENAKKLESQILYSLYDFLISARNSKLDKMISTIDEILLNSNNSEFYAVKLAPLYETLEKDKAKTIKILEDLIDKKDNFSALVKIIGYYKDANRKDDIKKIFTERLSHYPYFTGVATDYIGTLIDEKNYPEALKQIDKALSLFPYSYSLLEKKGLVYNYMANVKEAEKYYRLSLSHNAQNSTLRNKLYDITKTPDEIESINEKDKYKLIKDRRNSKLKSDYGVITLLDQYIVNILPEGGKKSKVAFIYEIISENGIEELKEYNLNTNYLTLQKSEIVKQNNTIVPAEEGDGKLVFKDLQVGDVIYIEYESYENSYGRFYKEFNLDCYFNSSYPSVESLFAVICPSNKTYNSIIHNGDITPIVKKINNKTATIWKRTNVPSIPLKEDFSKNYEDLTNNIYISSIKSWSEISNWYSDLVKKQLKPDKILKNTFTEIFPNGLENSNDESKAAKIYAYIENNIKYSSLDFRQSGYVPQTPSKTITTKLGDCKDMSTLFVALSELAGLKSNLVLVSTNDNSDNSLSLPSKDFNHCIVKTTLNNKDYFLELTDKYLPFKSLPVSLYQANALVISFDKSENQNSKLIKIPFDNVIKNEVNTKSIVTVSDTEIKITSDHIIQGSTKPYYNELFSTATTDDVRKEDLEGIFNSRLKKTVTMPSNKLIRNEPYGEDIEFETQLVVNERIKNVGNLKIIEIPFIDKVYTRDIIAKESRNYDIKYINYENILNYSSEVILNIPEGKKFTEIPENKEFSFKNHNFKIVFEIIKPNSLKVTRKVLTAWDNIETKDYVDFKKYVEDVLEVEEQVVGFK
jgi:tetratricopeptide (TPR) repeat protein